MPSSSFAVASSPELAQLAMSPAPTNTGSLCGGGGGGATHPSRGSSGHGSLTSSCPSPSLSESHTSPLPSPSRSFWSGLYCLGQLSEAFRMPSASRSLPTALATGAHNASAASTSTSTAASFL